MKTLNLLLAAAACAFGTTTAKSQVIISEIYFDSGNPAQSWIELRNQGSLEFDLSNFSIYHATKTAFRPQDYWFGIPAGTKIAPMDYIRILWGVAIPTTNNEPRDIYTGDRAVNFLFGHGFESLDPMQGAIGLCRTKLNTEMNLPGIFTDWVQWGGQNFLRGQTAVNSRLWESNTVTLPTYAVDNSLMVLYDERAKSSPPPLSAYKQDASPTPLNHNAFPLRNVQNFAGGSLPCGYRQPQPITLSSGIPYHGNADFELRVTGTQGAAFSEIMVLLFGATATVTKPDILNANGIIGGDCASLQILLPIPFITLNAETRLKIPLLDPSLANQTAFLQVATLSGQSPQYHGFSNVLELRTSQ